jgi:hypothetical protein
VRLELGTSSVRVRVNDSSSVIETFAAAASTLAQE